MSAQESIFCPRCGEKSNINAKFCMKCGCEFPGFEVDNSPSNQGNKKKKLGKILIAGTCLVVALAACISILLIVKSKRNNQDVQTKESEASDLIEKLDTEKDDVLIFEEYKEQEKENIEQEKQEEHIAQEVKPLSFKDAELVKGDIVQETDIVSMIENYYQDYYFCFNDMYLNNSEYTDEGYTASCTVEFTGSEDMLTQDYVLLYRVNEKGDDWELSDYRATSEARIVNCIEDTSYLDGEYYGVEQMNYNYDFSGTWVAYNTFSGASLLVYSIPKQNIVWGDESIECYYSVISISHANNGVYYGLVTTIPTYGVVDWNKRMIEVRGDGLIGGTGGYGYYGDLYFDANNISYYNERFLVNVDSYEFASIDEMAEYVKENGYEEFIGSEGSCQ